MRATKWEYDSPKREQQKKSYQHGHLQVRILEMIWLQA